MIGYLANPRVGVWTLRHAQGGTYNLIHHKGVAVTLYVLGNLLATPWLMFAPLRDDPARTLQLRPRPRLRLEARRCLPEHALGEDSEVILKLVGSMENIMSRHPHIFQVTIIFVIIMSSCNTASSLPVSETPQEVVQPIVEPASSATLSLLPTSNSANTLTVKSTFTPEVTQTLPAPSPTLFLLKTKFTLACQDEFFDKYTKISPDGNWLAEYCSFNGTMQVSNQDGTKSYVVDSKDYFYDPDFPELSGSVYPVHWTNDSHFVYFTVTPEQWNDGGFLALDSFAPLLGRMDIGNGDVYKVLSGSFYHSFSPTDRRLIRSAGIRTSYKANCSRFENWVLSNTCP